MRGDFSNRSRAQRRRKLRQKPPGFRDRHYGPVFGLQLVDVFVGERVCGCDPLCDSRLSRGQRSIAARLPPVSPAFASLIPTSVTPIIVPSASVRNGRWRKGAQRATQKGPHFCAIIGERQQPRAVNKRAKLADFAGFFNLSRASTDRKMVPGRGLEPPRPCERQHLKLVRLPIPPSGHESVKARRP